MDTTPVHRPRQPIATFARVGGGLTVELAAPVGG
jgi:hypothetical protein